MGLKGRFEMHRRLILGVVVVAIVAMVAAFGLERAASAGGKASAGDRITIPGSCPNNELALSPESVARAADQARVEAAAIYGRLGLGAPGRVSDTGPTGNAGVMGPEGG